MFNRASQRDKDRTIRVLSEIRSTQARAYRSVLQQMMDGVQAAHHEFTQKLRHIHQQAIDGLNASDAELNGVEQLCNTVLNQGANLAKEISTKEKRQVVEQARSKIDEILENAERSRAKLIEQSRCTHVYEATVVRDGEDGYTHVIEGECCLCDVAMEVPSEDALALEKKINEEKLTVKVQ